MRVGLRKNRIEAVNRIAGAFCNEIGPQDSKMIPLAYARSWGISSVSRQPFGRDRVQTVRVLGNVARLAPDPKENKSNSEVLASTASIPEIAHNGMIASCLRTTGSSAAVVLFDFWDLSNCNHKGFSEAEIGIIQHVFRGRADRSPDLLICFGKIAHVRKFGPALQSVLN